LKKYYSIPEVADILEFTNQSIINMIKAGKVKAIQPAGKNGRYRVPANEVERLLNNGKGEMKIKWEVGDKAILTYRPYEWTCPNCGAWPGFDDLFADGKPARVEITGIGSEGYCRKCRFIVPLSAEGWYETFVDGKWLVVPYTLLREVS